MAKFNLGTAVVKLVFDTAKAFNGINIAGAKVAAQAVKIGGKIQAAYGQRQVARINAFTQSLKAASTAQSTLLRGGAQIVVQRQKMADRLAFMKQSAAIAGGAAATGGVGAVGIAAAVTAGNLLAGAIAAAASKLIEAIQFAIRSILSLGRRSIEIGVGFNAQIEGMTTSFEVMLGSAARAQKLVAELRDFAKVTPFDLPGISQAAAMLLTTRKIAADQVIPTMRKIGDAAAGSAKGIESLPHVMLALTQMMMKGKIAAEEMSKQLVNAGIPAWTLLSEKMGISVKNLMEMAKKGKLGPEAVMTLIDAMGERFEGMMAKQAKNFTGLAERIKDSIGIALGRATEPLFANMKKRMGQLVAFMDTPEFEKGVESARSIVASFFSRVNQLVAFSVSSMKTFAAEFSRVGSLAIEVGRNIKSAIMPVLANIRDAIAKMFAGGDGGGMRTIAEQMEKILGVAATMTSDFGLAWDFVKVKAEESLLYIRDRIKYFFTEEIPQFFVLAAIRMYEAFFDGIKMLVKAFGVLAQFISHVFENVFKTLAVQIKELAKAMAKASVGDFAGAGAGIGTAAGAAAGSGAARSRIAGGAMKALGGIASDVFRGGIKKPPFKPSDEAVAKGAEAKSIWERLEAIRKRRSGEESARGKLRSGIDFLFGNALKGLDFVAGKLAGKHEIPAAPEDPAKERKAKFVGLGDLNKRIQESLTSAEAKDRKKLVKAAEKGAKAGEKGAAAGEKVAAAAGVLVGMFGKFIPGGFKD